MLYHNFQSSEILNDLYDQLNISGNETESYDPVSITEALNLQSKIKRYPTNRNGFFSVSTLFY